MTRIFALYGKVDRFVARLVNRLRLLRLKCMGARLGKNVRVYGKVIVTGDAMNLYIGDNTTINEGVILNTRAPIRIGKRVRLSAYSQIHTGSLLLNPYKGNHHHAQVVIGDDVWIASGVVISAGVTIGAGSVLAANSVVTKDVPVKVLSGGAPARVIRSL